MRNVIISWKEVGETPLECLERQRLYYRIEKDVPMTYAGRLDPMAEGILIILVGEECKKKKEYLGLDKKYEIEVLFGVESDTGDVLGLINTNKANFDQKLVIFSKYVKKFTQEYPAYSSKTVKGKQMHEYARSEELPDEIPTKEVEIYSIEKIGERGELGAEIAKNSIMKISKVKGDFRQKEIIKKWEEFGKNFDKYKFKIMTLKISCSSGTYMRVLAEKMGKDARVGALALSIKRTKIIQ